MSAPSAASPKPPALAAFDVAVPAALFVIALSVRIAEAAVLPFPALDDPAFYLKVAENVAAGKGLFVEAIWSYLVPFASVEHPSNEHWMPLTSLLLAPLFAVFGPSYKVAQAAGALAGSLLVLATWYAGRQALGPSGRWRGLTFFATVLVAFNPLLVYQSVTADSTVYFSVLGAGALLLLGRLQTPEGGRIHWADAAGCGAAGMLAGLAFLARTEGLVLLLVLAAWAWLTSGPVRVPRTAALLAGGALVAGPWLARNVLAFGSPFPVPSAALALLPDYPALFHYGGESFWNGFPAPDAGALVALRFQGLLHNLSAIALQAMFPVAPLALFGLSPFRQSRVLALALVFGAAVFLLTALLFPVLTLFGAFYHNLGFLVPFLALPAAAGLFRFGRFLGGRLFEDPDFMPVLLAAAVFVLVLVQLGLSAAAASQAHLRWGEDFAAASAWLRDHGGGTVMTNQPYSLHYASGLPAIQLPSGDPPDTALAAARRYGGRYAVVFGRFGRYPDALQSGGSPGFREVFASDRLWIYEVQ